MWRFALSDYDVINAGYKELKFNELELGVNLTIPISDGAHTLDFHSLPGLRGDAASICVSANCGPSRIKQFLEKYRRQMRRFYLSN